MAIPPGTGQTGRLAATTPGHGQGRTAETPESATESLTGEYYASLGRSESGRTWALANHRVPTAHGPWYYSKQGARKNHIDMALCYDTGPSQPLREGRWEVNVPRTGPVGKSGGKIQHGSSWARHWYSVAVDQSGARMEQHALAITVRPQPPLLVKLGWSHFSQQKDCRMQSCKPVLECPPSTPLLSPLLASPTVIAGGGQTPYTWNRLVAPGVPQLAGCWSRQPRKSPAWRRTTGLMIERLIRGGHELEVADDFTLYYVSCSSDLPDEALLGAAWSKLGVDSPTTTSSFGHCCQHPCFNVLEGFSSEWRLIDGRLAAARQQCGAALSWGTAQIS